MKIKKIEVLLFGRCLICQLQKLRKNKIKENRKGKKKKIKGKSVKRPKRENNPSNQLTCPTLINLNRLQELSRNYYMKYIFILLLFLC